MYEELLKELDNIYDSEKTKEVLKNYITYVELRKEKKVKFGTYNIYIRNKSKQRVKEELIQLMCKILKTEGIINTSYKYLEKDREWDRNGNNKKKKSTEKHKYFKNVKEQLCIIDIDELDIYLNGAKNDIRKYIQEFPDKIFIIIDKENTDSFFYDEEENLEEIDQNFGDLFNWTIEIEKSSKENNAKYINKFLKQNSIKVAKDSTFVQCLAEEKYCKIKSELQNIVLECKAENIEKITDEVIRDNLKKKYYKKTSKNKLPPMEELNSMIGISQVKNQIEQIVNFIKINKQKDTLPSLHMCFLGNPGTGKTTVARIIGRIFAEMKILSDKEIFVEAQRTDLIGEYVGSTAPKTKRKVEKANGGVLFIDEAYSLCPKGYGFDYGKECIATLMKEMEDKRESLCVILAGYTKETKEMLEVNPGFESRIQFYIEFPDYTEEELYEIFKKMAKDGKYKISSNLKPLLIEYFSKEKGKENFSNARCVRNLFEKIKFEQADRVARNSKEELDLIKKCDVENVLNKISKPEKKKIRIGFAN